MLGGKECHGQRAVEGCAFGDCRGGELLQRAGDRRARPPSASVVHLTGDRTAVGLRRGGGGTKKFGIQTV